MAPALGAKALNGKLKELGRPMDTRILDVASGTGMVGEALKQLGYTNIDGLDGSISSLEFSKKKGVYRNLIRGFLESKDSKDLGVAADQYDAAICIGGFSKYHLKSEALDDLVYVVKPGGIVCFTIRDIVAEDPEYGYNEKMKKLCEEKKWKLVSKFQEEYATAKNIKCWLYIYEIQ